MGKGLSSVSTTENEAKSMALLNKLIENPMSIQFNTLPAEHPGPTERTMRRLTQAETSRNIAGCKSRNITITAAVHAALMLASQQCAPPPENKPNGKYMCTDAISVDIRKYCHPPYNGSQIPISTMHTGVPMVVELPTVPSPALSKLPNWESSTADFERVARQVCDINRMDVRAAMFDFLPQWVSKIMAAYTTPPSEDYTPPACPALSSLGILENRLKHVYEGVRKVELLECTVRPEMLDQRLMGYAWTWRGRLEIALMWNRAFYEEDLVERLMEKWRSIHLRGLE